MTETWDKLRSREKDVLVCERVLGWERCDFIIADTPPDGVMPIDVGAPYYWTTPSGEIRYLQTPWPLSKDQEVLHCTTDHNACRLVLDEIARQRRGAGFVYALGAVLGLSGAIYQGPDPDDLFRVLLASPDQVCHAACRVMGAEV